MRWSGFACCISIPRGSPRADRDHPRDQRPVLRPVAPARLTAAAARHAPLGGRRSIHRAHRRHPARGTRRDLPFVLHLGLSRRERRRPGRALRLPARRAVRLGRILHLLRRGGNSREGSRRSGAPRLALERLREVTEVQDAITAAKRDALVGRTRAAHRRPRCRAQCARVSRDRWRHSSSSGALSWVPWSRGRSPRAAASTSRRWSREQRTHLRTHGTAYTRELDDGLSAVSSRRSSST